MANITGTVGNDILTGTATDDIIDGLAGNDRITGGLGSDTLFGGDGDDYLDPGAGYGYVDGGAGFDTLHVDRTGTSTGVILALNRVVAGREITTDAVERLIFLGGSGNDNVRADSGNDTLKGGDGDDILNPGTGDDLVDGGAGNDRAQLYRVNTSVGVTFALDSGHTSDGATLTSIESVEYLGGSGADVITGGSSADSLSGNGGNDTLQGGDGRDTLDGGDGNDVIRGGAGADLLFAGNSGFDALMYSESNVGVIVYLNGLGHTRGGNAEGDQFFGFEAVYGSQGDDVLIGGDGNDSLSGAAGNDQLFGQGGKDAMAGGAGADRFVLQAVAYSAVAAPDLIADFSRAQRDRIDLHLADADTTAAGDQAFSFIGAAAFGHHAGEVRATTAGGTTTVSGDVDGDGAADFAITLIGAITLVAADFLL